VDATLARAKAWLATPVGTRLADIAIWIAVVAITIVVLLWPALRNGFPIVFYDTGGYLAAAVEGQLANGRAALYGALLTIAISSDFWLVVVVQSATVVWLLALVLRLNGLGGRPLLLLSVSIGLALATALPWYTAQLMPDIWLLAAVLALYALAFGGSRLRLMEVAALIAVAAFAAATHMGTLALVLAVCAACAAMRIAAARLRMPRPSLARPLAAAVFGIALALLSNLAFTGELRFTPGGSNFLFGRLVQTGIAAQWLEDNCPDPAVELCTYRTKLPATGDDWLWDQASPLVELGGWDTFADEARSIVLSSLASYPLAHLRAALGGTVAQFLMVASGDGLTPWSWHTQWAIETFAPHAFDAYRSAGQQRAAFDFTVTNRLHVPVALAGIFALPLLVWMARRGLLRPSAGVLAGTVLFALVANAAVCGALSNPHHRYQSRLAPLAPFAFAVALLSTYGRRRADSGIRIAGNRADEASRP